jgi:hypothetical protein
MVSRRNVTMLQATSITPKIASATPTGRGEPSTSARWIMPVPRAANASQVRVTVDMVLSSS